MSKAIHEAQAILLAREQKGISTYGNTVDNPALKKEHLLDHAIEEAADLLIYLVACRQRDRQQIQN